VLNVRISFLLAALVATTIIGTDVSNGQGTRRPGTVVPGTGRPSTTQPRSTASARTAPVATPKQGTTVAVIDIGYIFKNARRFKMTMEDLKKGDEKFQEEITVRRDNINADIQELQRRQRSDPTYKRMEEDIAGAQTKLRLDVARAQKERVEKEAKVYFNAYREVEDQINKFASRYGIDLVLRFNSEKMDPAKPETVLSGINRFVVFQRQLNITGHILDEMNKGGAQPPPRQTSFPPRPGTAGTRPR